MNRYTIKRLAVVLTAMVSSLWWGGSYAIRFTSAIKFSIR